jgi:hypothetical protein
MSQRLRRCDTFLGTGACRWNAIDRSVSYAAGGNPTLPQRTNTARLSRARVKGIRISR